MEMMMMRKNPAIKAFRHVTLAWPLCTRECYVSASWHSVENVITESYAAFTLGDAQSLNLKTPSLLNGEVSPWRRRYIETTHKARHYTVHFHVFSLDQLMCYI